MVRTFRNGAGIQLGDARSRTASLATDLIGPSPDSVATMVSSSSHGVSIDIANVVVAFVNGLVLLVVAGVGMDPYILSASRL